MPKDLRTFIEEVAGRYPDEIKIVDQEVDAKFGMTAVAARFEQQSKYPALFFPKVRNSRLPAVVNLSATYERLALGLGTTVAQMVRLYGERQTTPVNPVMADAATAPVKEVVLTGADATLDILPIPTHNALDAGPYLTGALLVCRDQDFFFGVVAQALVEESKHLAGGLSGCADDKDIAELLFVELVSGHQPLQDLFIGGENARLFSFCPSGC